MFQVSSDGNEQSNLEPVGKPLQCLNPCVPSEQFPICLHVEHKPDGSVGPCSTQRSSEPLRRRNSFQSRLASELGKDSGGPGEDPAISSMLLFLNMCFQAPTICSACTRNSKSCKRVQTKRNRRPQRPPDEPRKFRTLDGSNSQGDGSTAHQGRESRRLCQAPGLVKLAALCPRPAPVGVLSRIPNLNET